MFRITCQATCATRPDFVNSELSDCSRSFHKPFSVSCVSPVSLYSHSDLYYSSDSCCAPTKPNLLKLFHEGPPQVFHW